LKASKIISPSAPPRVFLYVRYSSSEQSKGDSVRRQRELGKKRARELGIKIDEILSITDEGISAFRGKNRTHGALAGFLKQVEEGRVPHGSELWVENLDRLSRDYLTSALTVFLQIVNAGLTIVTLDDRNEYNLKTLNRNMGHLVTSLVHMSTAHDHSAIKSSRGKENWDGKRKNIAHVKLTALAPAWLKLAADRKSFELIKERVAIVRWIFQQRAKGIGVFRIARQLNDRGEPVWGRGKRAGYQWHRSYIVKILANRSVLGEFQPHKMDGEERVRVPAGPAVRNYFPAIIRQALFDRVQQLKQIDTKRPGKIGDKVSNLFTWIARCGRTGKPAVYVDKSGKRRKPKKRKGTKRKAPGKRKTGKLSARTNYKYLRTDGVLGDGRRMVGWHYDDFEMRFLTGVGRLDLNQIFGSQDDTATTEMEFALAAAKARVQETELELRRLLKILQSYRKKAPETVLDQMTKLETDRANQRREVQTATLALDKARQAAADAARFSNNFKRLMTERRVPETRLALRNEIRNIISRIDVYFDIAETAAERRKREAFAAAVAKMPKGIKVIGGIPSSKAPARHMVVTFANGVRRTIAQSHDGKVLVYESNNTPAAFEVVEIPRRTNSFKAVDDSDKDS
jgi:hypothetical protein